MSSNKSAASIQAGRYNEADINEALNIWPAKEPPSALIPSRLLHYKNDNCNELTTIFIVRSSAISYVPVLHHYYIEFNGLEWHPGAPHDPIFEPKRENRRGNMQLRKIIECCEYCARIYMNSNFERDKGFNLIFNNCQIQFGVIAESLLAMFFIVTLIVGIIIKSLFVIVINAVSLISIIITSVHDKEIEYEVCTHIKL